MKKNLVLSVKCPRCGAEPGKRCLSRIDLGFFIAHNERWKKAREGA